MDIEELLMPQICNPGDECALVTMNRSEAIQKLGRVIHKVEGGKHRAYKVKWDDGEEAEVLADMLARVVRLPDVGPIYVANMRTQGRLGFAGVMIMAPYAKEPS